MAPQHRLQHQSLKKLSQEHWTHRNRLDSMLSKLQSAQAFAEPLLSDALKTRFDLDLDVKTTFLRLYIPQTVPLVRESRPAPRAPGPCRCSTPPCTTFRNRKQRQTLTSQPRRSSPNLRPQGSSIRCRRSSKSSLSRPLPGCAGNWISAPGTTLTSKTIWG